MRPEGDEGDEGNEGDDGGNNGSAGEARWWRRSECAADAVMAGPLALPPIPSMTTARAPAVPPPPAAAPATHKKQACSKGVQPPALADLTETPRSTSLWKPPRSVGRSKKKSLTDLPIDQSIDRPTNCETLSSKE